VHGDVLGRRQGARLGAWGQRKYAAIAGSEAEWRCFGRFYCQTQLLAQGGWAGSSLLLVDIWLAG